MTDLKGQSFIFRHLILEGTAYDVGKILGNYIRNETDLIRELTRNPSKVEQKEKILVQKSMEYFDTYCPEINDEIKGVSEGLGVDVEQLLYYFASCRYNGGCSQMAVLPKITSDGHIYLARNYDYSPEESDLCLMTTKVEGKANHIGFSELWFGRTDGINEHGLCISMSNAAPGITANCNGLEFWVVIRVVLDSCTTVNEAIVLIDSIPTSTYTNFIVVDRSANAALIEVAGSKKSFQRIYSTDSMQYLCATNHFKGKQMQKYDNGRYWDSVARYQAMELRINDAIPYVDKKSIKDIQSDFIPLGTCCHHYSSRFGTLWSVIYDLTDINLEVCFGSPKANDWHIFDLIGSFYKNKYLINLPDSEKKPIWKKLPPGANNCSDICIY